MAMRFQLALEWAPIEEAVHLVIGMAVAPVAVEAKVFVVPIEVVVVEAVLGVLVVVVAAALALGVVMVVAVSMMIAVVVQKGVWVMMKWEAKEWAVMMTRRMMKMMR